MNNISGWKIILYSGIIYAIWFIIIHSIFLTPNYLCNYITKESFTWTINSDYLNWLNIYLPILLGIIIAIIRGFTLNIAAKISIYEYIIEYFLYVFIGFIASVFIVLIFIAAHDIILWTINLIRR